MKRLLAPVAFLLALGLAGASELPESMTLMCGDQAIGVAEYDEGELEVTLLEGFACTGTISIAEDDSLFVAIDATDEGFSVTITADPTSPVVATEVEVDDTLDGPPTDAGQPENAGDPEEAGVDISSLPQVAQDGMAEAATNREEATQHAEEARSHAEESGRPDDAGRPEGAGNGSEPEDAEGEEDED